MFIQKLGANSISQIINFQISWNKNIRLFVEDDVKQVEPALQYHWVET